MDTAIRIGLSFSDGSITYTEIRSWMKLSKVKLSMWEVETIHSLSATFVNACYALKDEDTLPPWMPDGRREALEEQSKEFDKFFGKRVTR